MGSSHGFMVKEFHLWNIRKEASVLPALFLHSPLKDWEKDLNTYSCLSLLNVRPACLWRACIFPAVLLCTRHKWTCPSQREQVQPSPFLRAGPVGAGKLLMMWSLYTWTISLKQKAKVYTGAVLRSPTVEGHRLKSHFPIEQNHQH